MCPECEKRGGWVTRITPHIPKIVETLQKIAAVPPLDGQEGNRNLI